MARGSSHPLRRAIGGDAAKQITGANLPVDCGWTAE
jgi:hypothetical protein